MRYHPILKPQWDIDCNSVSNKQLRNIGFARSLYMYKFLSTKTVIHQNNSLVIIVDVNEINVSIKADHLPDELLIGRSRFL